MRKNLSDILFRVLFSLIFIGLGSEHALSDDLLQKLMPPWVPAPRIVSILCGLFLFTGGFLIAIGYRLKLAAKMLGIFLLVVTILVHAPELVANDSPAAHPDDQWMWTALQRSNFVKNLCLIGVCVMLPYYQVGDWSVEKIVAKRR